MCLSISRNYQAFATQLTDYSRQIPKDSFVEKFISVLPIVGVWLTRQRFADEIPVRSGNYASRLADIVNVEESDKHKRRVELIRLETEEKKDLLGPKAEFLKKNLIVPMILIYGCWATFLIGYRPLLFLTLSFTAVDLTSRILAIRSVNHIETKFHEYLHGITDPMIN